MLPSPKNPAPKPALASSQPPTPTDPISQSFPNLPTSSNAIGNIPDAPDDNLSEAQRTAINLLILGLSDTAIAKQLSLTRRTIYNWKKTDSHFRAELRRRHEELCESTLSKFLTGLQLSLDTLTKQAAHPYAPTSHRAARTLLTLSRIGQHLYNLTDPKLQSK